MLEILARLLASKCSRFIRHANQHSFGTCYQQVDAIERPSCCGWLAGYSLFAILLGNPNYQWSADRSSPFGADFVQEWVAGDMLLAGAAEHIYDRAAFQSWQHDAERMGFTWPSSQYYPAVYPPPYYCFTAPLARLPYRVAAVLWLMLLVAAYGAAASLAIRCWSESGTSREQWWWCVGLIFPAMFFGCVLGQKGSLWLLAISGSVYLLKHQRPLAAGCVAAVLTLKPTLCVLLPVAMLITGQWRFCLGFFVTALGIYGGSALMLPFTMWHDYWQVVLGASEYQSHAGYRSGWSTSLMTLLAAVGTPKSLSYIVAAAAACALLMNCVVQSRKAGAASPMVQPECLWQLLVGTALLSPHAYFYDLTWLLVPLGGMLQSQPRQALRSLAIVWIGMVLGQAFEFGPAIPAMALLIALAQQAVTQFLSLNFFVRFSTDKKLNDKK